MRTLTVITVETTTRITTIKVPDHFDDTNEDHRDALNDRAMDLECGEDSIERTLTIERANGARAIDGSLDETDIDPVAAR